MFQRQRRSSAAVLTGLHVNAYPLTFDIKYGILTLRGLKTAYRVPWPSGKAEACKAFIGGSNPPGTSKNQPVNLDDEIDRLLVWEIACLTSMASLSIFCHTVPRWWNW